MVVNGKELVRVSPNAVRAARYLSLISEIIERDPGVLKKLETLSKEYRVALGFND